MKFLLSIWIFIFTLLNAAPTQVDSREYKLMLNASLFDGTNPLNNIAQYWSALGTLIDNELVRERLGSFSLDKERTLMMYDTAGSCLLYNNSLIFRERIEDGNREVTLKYRSADRCIAGHQDMDGTGVDAQTKLEEDLGVPYVSKFSHSTTQSISASKNINKLEDPIELYPDHMNQYNFNEDTTIVKVGGLTIYERVYKGTKVDLGNKDAEFALTLWYTSPTSTTPVVAEISFKYEDENEDFTQNVVTRAKKLFELMQSLSSWNNPNSTTKTAFIYNYNPSFCN
ncbi:MAG: hypothetical protein JXQ76_04470 [Campylobacterales bacterium]|nr:hypothetical protein [Campylobacterales bacterium]